MKQIKPGSLVKLENETIEVETFWNQGKHRVFKDTTGKLWMDLHLVPHTILAKMPRDFKLPQGDIHGEEG